MNKPEFNLTKEAIKLMRFEDYEEIQDGAMTSLLTHQSTEEAAQEAYRLAWQAGLLKKVEFYESVLKGNQGGSQLRGPDV